MERATLIRNYLEAGAGNSAGKIGIITSGLINCIGTWEFDPVDLENPFLNNETSVHMWLRMDMCLFLCSFTLPSSSHGLGKHELLGAGHVFPYADGLCLRPL